MTELVSLFFPFLLHLQHFFHVCHEIFNSFFVSFLFVSINSWINYLMSLMNSVANQWISWLLMTLLVFLYKFHFFVMKMQNDLTINYSFFNRYIRVIMILQSTHNFVTFTCLATKFGFFLVSIDYNWIDLDFLSSVTRGVKWCFRYLNRGEECKWLRGTTGDEDEYGHGMMNHTQQENRLQRFLNSLEKKMVF